MTINFKGGRSIINTGTNLLDNEQVSPTTNLLGAHPLASVAPNMDSNMEAVAGTQVGSTPSPEASMAPQGAPMEDTRVLEESQATPVGLPEDMSAVQGQPLADDQVAVEQVVSTEDTDPFSESIHTQTRLSYQGNSFGDSLNGKKAYQSKEQNTWDSVKESTISGLYDLNKVAYGTVKGAAGVLDVGTVPVWALGHVLADGQTMPFTSMLEQYYPEKSYQFDEDPNTIADELLRFSQTGAEFISGGGLTNIGAKVATKGAYLPTLASDIYLSGLSAFGYQGALEMGGSDTTALLTAFLAPSGPTLMKAFYKTTIKTVGASGKPVIWAFDKATSVLPVAGLIKSTVRASAQDFMRIKKQELIANPEMWSQGMWKKKARDIVMRTPDKIKTVEEQQNEIASIKRWVSSAIPDSPEMREHLDRMQSLQDNINADLPEELQVSFTLEQLYNPILKKNGMDDGIKEVMGSLRLTNGEAYDNQLRQNQKALYEYIKNKKGELGPEETRAFTDLFDTHLTELTKVQDNIYAMSNAEPLLNQSTVGYEYADQAISESLRPAAVEVRGLLGDAYEAMLERLPKDIELDTTPLRDSVNEVYDSLSLFSDPKAIPAYLKDVVKALVKNADDGTEDVYVGLKNEASKLGGELNQINQELRTLAHEQKVALSSFNPEDTSGLAKLKADQDVVMLELKGKHSDLLQRQKDLDIAKRSAKKDKAGELMDLPEPNLVTVDDVRQGLKVVNGKMRDAYSSGSFEQYEILKRIHSGLSDSMEGLKEVDSTAYELFQTTNGHYTRFVATDFDESMAHKLVEKGNHLFKIVSEDAVKMIWDSNGTEGMQRFLRNFDGTREGLKSFLDNIDVPEGEITAVDAYSKASEKAVGALKDMVYTTLARQVNKIDADVELDPAMRMEKIKKVLIDFQDKHKSKLDQIPGLENLSEDSIGTIQRLSKYRIALQQIDERNKLSILRDVVGPGKSASNIMNDRSTAEEMYNFLNNELPKIDIDGTGNLKVAEAEANAIRKTLRQGFLNEFTKNNMIDYKGLDRVLATGSSTRNNLSLVLGEQEILKLDTFRVLGRAWAEGNTKFTEVLTNDSTLRKLENLGLPLGRLGSILQRRAVFTPSGGYLAGAIATKALNAMGNQNTSRAMQLMVERPFDMLNLDQILLKEMKDLPPQRSTQVKDVMENATRHMRELAAWLPKQMSKHVQAQLAYLGFEMSTSEVATMIEEVLYDDPRHPELTKEEPVVEAPVETPVETPVTPEITNDKLKELIRGMSPEERKSLMDITEEGQPNPKED